MRRRLISWLGGYGREGERAAFQARLLDSVGEAIIATDASGTIIFWNRAAEELYGWDRGEVLGRNILDVTTTLSGRDRAEEIMERLRVGESWSGEYVVPDREGEEIPVFVHDRPVLDDEGELVGVIGVSTDISDLKETQEQLRRRQREFEALVEHSPDVVMRFDRAHRHTFVNSTITAYSNRPPEEYEGRTPEEVGYRPELAARWDAMLDRVFEEGEDRTFEFDVDTKRGERHFHAYLVPEEHETGRVETVLALSRDLTPQKRVTDRLEQLSRRLVDLQEEERRRLALELHDEFGQTVTALSMALDLEDEGLTEDQRTALEQARRLVGHLGEQIRRITLDLRPSQLDDLGLVPALHAFLKRYQETTGVEVEFAHDGVRDRELPSRIAAAAYRLVQESLTNVARHADVDRAEVRVWGKGEHLELRVRDHGSGFEESSVTGGSLTRGISGMRERVEVLGGQFEVTSTPGEGTRVLARLPYGIEPSERRPAV